MKKKTIVYILVLLLFVSFATATIWDGFSLSGLKSLFYEKSEVDSKDSDVRSSILTNITNLNVSVVVLDNDVRASILNNITSHNETNKHGNTTEEILGVVNGSDINASGMTLARLSGSTFSTVQDLQNIYHSVGWVSGGNITGNISHINISAGNGLIRGVDDRVSTIFYFDWSEATNQAIPANSTRYIGIEYNSGSPQVIIKSLDSWDYQTDFPLGTVVREDTGMHILHNPQAIGDHASFMVIRSYQTMPFARDSRTGGLILGTKGQNITMTAGTLWDRLNDFSLTAKDTGGFDTMDRYFRDGNGGFAIEQGVSQWNNSKYDDGTGILASLSNNRYAVQWFYIEVDDELVSVYGTAQYVSLAGAEAEGVPSSVPDRLSKHGKLIGRIIFQEGTTEASSIESVFTITFAGAVITDHGDLAGLADDDHTQYLLATGGRALTGNWDTGGFNITSANNLQLILGAWKLLNFSTAYDNRNPYGTTNLTNDLENNPVNSTKDFNINLNFNITASTGKVFGTNYTLGGGVAGMWYNGTGICIGSC